MSFGNRIEYSKLEPAAREVALVEPVETREGRVLISVEEAEANANLFAAAPGMLAVLEQFVSRVGFRLDDPRLEIWEQAKKEIAKARGVA